MEPQEVNYTIDNKGCQKKNCLNCVKYIAVIFLMAFAVVMGLIVGALVAETLLSALSSLIVLAVILGLLFIVTFVLLLCNKPRGKKEKYICCCK